MPDYFCREQAEKREKEVSDLLGRKILDSEIMLRLRTVSFLGILGVAINSPVVSRYDHCISVAYLTWKYCEKLNLPPENILTLTLFALIHDIGHPPYSHSTEVYLRERATWQKTERSAFTPSKIEKVLKDGYESFPTELKIYSVEDLTDLLHKISYSRPEREKYSQVIADIYDSPFCPDTFDGVNRAWCVMNIPQVKKQLQAYNCKTILKPMDPKALIEFISSASLPLVFKSRYQPSDNNPIAQFHTLTRVLYNEIIYSDWQSSAMVMFAKAEEYAYEGIEHFHFSNMDDARVIRKINRKDVSRNLYQKIQNGKYYVPLSKKLPEIYSGIKDLYNRSQHEASKKILEEKVNKVLGSAGESVYCYVYYPLIWSYNNISYAPIDKKLSSMQTQDMRLWQIKWEKEEGERSSEPRIEVFFDPNSIQIKKNNYRNC